MSTVTLSFAKNPAALGYNVYRNDSPFNIGPAKLNVVTIPQPGGPGPVLFLDDGINSTSAPVTGKTYFYRVTALDINAIEGLPSSALKVSLTTVCYVQSDLRQNVVAYLTADTTLNGLLGSDAANRIYSQHKYQEMRSNTPFLVVSDGEFVENNKYKDPGFRLGIQTMQFDCYDETQASQATENILNRVAALLRDNATGGGGRRHVSSDSIRVHFCVPMNGFQEFYDQAVRLPAKRLVVEFTVRMKQT